MTKKISTLACIALLAAIALGIQACGQSGGFGVGGKVIISGATN